MNHILQMYESYNVNYVNKAVILLRVTVNLRICHFHMRNNGVCIHKCSILIIQVSCD